MCDATTTTRAAWPSQASAAPRLKGSIVSPGPTATKGRPRRATSARSCQTSDTKVIEVRAPTGTAQCITWDFSCSPAHTIQVAPMGPPLPHSTAGLAAATPNKPSASSDTITNRRLPSEPAAMRGDTSSASTDNVICPAYPELRPSTASTSTTSEIRRVSPSLTLNAASEVPGATCAVTPVLSLTGTERATQPGGTFTGAAASL